jgi:hypothetical protein
MSDFETLKAGLKDKWLDYYEVNQSWICKLGCWVECVQSKNKRPNAKAILAAISTLEPKIIDYLIPLVDINYDGEQVVKALGLDFRPQTELETREEERSKETVTQLESQFSDPELEEIRRQIQAN